jgi:hypothetical protein
MVGLMDGQVLHPDVDTQYNKGARLGHRKPHTHSVTPRTGSRHTWRQELGKGVQPDDAPLGVQRQVALLQAVKAAQSCVSIAEMSDDRRR